jgi:hypothetical protein
VGCIFPVLVRLALVLVVDLETMVGGVGWRAFMNWRQVKRMGSGWMFNHASQRLRFACIKAA